MDSGPDLNADSNYISSASPTHENAGDPALSYDIPPLMDDQAPPIPVKMHTDIPTGKSSAPPPRPKQKKAPELKIIERKNWLIHLHYVRKEFDVCKSIISEILAETTGMCEYALYVQALIARQEGRIAESLDIFQTCSLLNPNSTDILKQVARSLYLLGRHSSAIGLYKQAASMGEDDWEVHHNQGVCHMYLGEQGHAKECLQKALACQRHDLSYIMLAKVHLMEGEIRKALEIQKQAVEYSPENPDLLTSLGLLYMEMGHFQKAFENLGNALTYDPGHPKAILAAGSMIQSHGDYDVALTKYRLAAKKTPESAPLWSNIGMCFFGRKKYVAAVSCLKRANYLSPFDWKILYNLGLLHLAMQQYASAFHFLSSSINVKPRSSQLYMLMGVTLTHLEDFESAREAYTYATKFSEPSDLNVHLNFAIFMHNQNDKKAAVKQFTMFEQKLSEMRINDPKGIDKELVRVGETFGAVLQVGDKLVWKGVAPLHDQRTTTADVNIPQRSRSDVPDGPLVPGPLPSVNPFEQSNTNTNNSVLESRTAAQSSFPDAEPKAGEMLSHPSQSQPTIQPREPKDQSQPAFQPSEPKDQSQPNNQPSEPKGSLADSDPIEDSMAALLQSAPTPPTHLPPVRNLPPVQALPPVRTERKSVPSEQEPTLA